MNVAILQNLPLNLLPNILAFISVLFYFLSLLPGLLNYVNPEWRSSKFAHIIKKHRRGLGILAFVFGFLHGAIIAVKNRINFSDPMEYLKYIPGILLLTIFSVLALTSNNYSVHHLKRNWKRLHQLTFVAMFILVWHVVDKMYGNFTIFTPIILAACFLLIAFYTKRKLTEYFGEG